MDLLDTWKKLDQLKLSKPVAGVINPPSRSSHTVAKVKRSYFLKIALSFLFLIISILLLITSDDNYVQIGMTIVTASYVLFLVSALVTYKKIKVELPVDGSLKNALEYTIATIKTNLQFEERAALVVYPFAVTSGFLMGFTVSGRNAATVFSETVFGIALLAAIVILTPLCYLLARWMNKITYGKCLSEMENMVKDLESDR